MHNQQEVQKKLHAGLSVLCAVVAVMGAMVVASCEDSSDDSVDPNASSISGYVNSYVVAGNTIKLPGPRRGLARLMDRVIRPVYAGVANVRVSVNGTDVATTTTDDGYFILSGVPPGEQVLTFSWGTSSATYTISVPTSSTIVMGSVSVTGDSVSVSDLVITENETDNTSTDNTDTGDDNASSDNDVSDDNTGGDDNVSDDNVVDDNDNVADDNDNVVDDNANENG